MQKEFSLKNEAGDKSLQRILGVFGFDIPHRMLKGENHFEDSQNRKRL